MRAFNHRATGPVIQRLREQAQDIKSDELERLMNKLHESKDPRVVDGGDKFDKYPYYGGSPQKPGFKPRRE